MANSNTNKKNFKSAITNTKTIANTNAQITKKNDNEGKPSGVAGETYKNFNTEFKTSSDFTKKDAEVGNAASNYKTLIDTDNIISKSTQKAMNQEFVVPSAVTEADAYLKTQLEKIQSGKTSYSDQVKGMMDKIMNREKFSYDVDTDPLFQQALASAMNSGKIAMQDTIGQASALTGGYGSTYATTAGNQAYNSFIEDAYDNLPQYYQMAMEAYQMEGDEMYRQLGMLSDADNTEYNRNVTAYDATYQHRNQIYNEAYSKYRDDKSDAFAMANLELSEYGQRVNDAYNYYNIASDQAKTQYEREYTAWADSINQAYQLMTLQNSDYWSQTNFDEGVRQYEKSFAEDVRQFDTNFAEQQRQFDTNFTEQQRQFNANLAEQQRQHNDQMSYNWASLQKSSSGGSGGSGGSGYDYTAEDMSKASKSQAVKSFKTSVLTENEFVRRGKSTTIDGKKVRFDTYNEYIDAVLGNWNSDGKLTEKETAYLVGYYFG